MSIVNRTRGTSVPETRCWTMSQARGRSDVPIVVMGPSGSGKSTLARALAAALGRRFIEGDEYHSAANRRKMAAGQALTDAEREPFLDSLGRELAGLRQGAVATCSALRRAHRDRLRTHRPDLLFIWLDVAPRELERRVQDRTGHFMPASLVVDQIATFEPPTGDENALRIDGHLPTADQVDCIRNFLGD